MTPRTRSSNKDTDFKVYYSKNVPQQVRFPHKRKTVRRRSTPGQDGKEKQQMIFLPDKMKKRRVTDVRDSDEESEDDPEDDESFVNLQRGEMAQEENTGSVDNTSATAKKARGKKRKSDIVENSNETPKAALSEDPTPTKRSRRSNQNEQHVPRTIRRQSTMTQLVDGRRPEPEDEEPKFQPVSRGARLSWSGKRENNQKDKQQRTLTQMIPGMRATEPLSDDEEGPNGLNTEEQEAESQEYDEAIARRLAQRGFHHVADDKVKKETVELHEVGSKISDMSSVDPQSIPDVVAPSVENMELEDESSYAPTQYIDAPYTKTRRTRQDRPTRDSAANSRTKARFGLLATPEKRRIREIPSSQSPAESPLSTQVSPRKGQRSPLHECSGNTSKAIGTPSKRKRVVFEEPRKSMPPPRLRKFESTIQDSEDEDEDLIEDDNLNQEPVVDQQLPVQGDIASGQAIGSETQAILEQIDQACAGPSENPTASPGESMDLDDEVTGPAIYEPSPELGDHDRHPQALAEDGRVEEDMNIEPVVLVKQEQPWDEDEEIQRPIRDGRNVPGKRRSLTRKIREAEEQPAAHTDAESKPQHHSTTQVKLELDAESQTFAPNDEIRSTPPIIPDLPQESHPSTPMVLHDSSDDEAPSPSPSPEKPHTYSLPPPFTSTMQQQSADLDGEPVQVPRSPSPHGETQHSHTSKAEQQLQSEWLSYSQYVNTRRPDTSSMHVAHDAFSYNATPKPAHTTTQPQPSGRFTSQATTVDEVTQRTPRKQMSAQRVESSVSPVKPPSLFIPSSFPSPGRVAMEGWSSPVMMETQGRSLEDFSIPLPPPTGLFEYEDEDE